MDRLGVRVPVLLKEEVWVCVPVPVPVPVPNPDPVCVPVLDAVPLFVSVEV
jgi:hypothetical protein